MSSPFRRTIVSVAVVLIAMGACSFGQPALKVCADPDNLPFSNRQQAGFENRIAAVIGAQLGRKVEFTWGRMGRGFVREYVNKGQCDVLFGVPKGMRGVLVSNPYYRSSYVFVTRRGKRITSLDDPALRKMKIGVQVLDDDYAPPGLALARRGLVSNITGFDMEDPGEIVRAVANRRVDVAIVWGPTAGYFAKRLHNQLQIAPVTPEFDPPGLTLAYDIAIGVRKTDHALLQEVDHALIASQPAIQRILRSYNVPVTSPTAVTARGTE